MYKLLDNYTILYICEYCHINDTINLLKSNVYYYIILNKFNYKFNYKFINYNQLCIKCFKPCTNESVVFVCKNHFKYPTYHSNCYSSFNKGKFLNSNNFRIDNCIYCKENIFAVKIRNFKYIFE